MSKQMVAFFETKQQAEDALRRLTEIGVRNEDVSVLTRQDVPQYEPVGNARDGMTTGGVIGAATGLIMGLSAFAAPGLGLLAAAGPVASLLAGAAAGGIIGSLADMGFSDADTKSYMKEIERGSVFMSLEAKDVEKARQLLEAAGAYRIDVI